MLMSSIFRSLAASSRFDRSTFASRFEVIMPPMFTARLIRASKYSASVLLSASSLAFPAAVAKIFSFISSSARCRCNISATTVALGAPPGLEHEARASETIKGATAPALGGPLGLEQADSGIAGPALARELFTFTALIKNYW